MGVPVSIYNPGLKTMGHPENSTIEWLATGAFDGQGISTFHCIDSP